MNQEQKQRAAQDLEQQLSDLLTEGEMESVDRKARERQQISPKYEIRVQTTHDPVAEETKIYRRMAKEVDRRYDRYVEE
jgi:hypothetical protein